MVWSAAAAALVAVTLAAGMLLTGGPDLAAPAWQRQALAIHDAWANAAPTEETAPTPGLVLASLGSLGATVRVSRYGRRSASGALACSAEAVISSLRWARPAACPGRAGRWPHGVVPSQRASNAAPMV